MEKQTRIDALTQRLQQAGSRRDWQGLKRIDAEIFRQVEQWRAGQSGWSDEERQALERLKAVHARICAQCDAEVQVLGQTLTRINAQQGRWQAYAQSSSWGDSAL